MLSAMLAEKAWGFPRAWRRPPRPFAVMMPCAFNSIFPVPRNPQAFALRGHLAYRCTFLFREAARLWLAKATGFADATTPTSLCLLARPTP